MKDNYAHPYRGISRLASIKFKELVLVRPKHLHTTEPNQHCQILDALANSYVTPLLYIP